MELTVTNEKTLYIISFDISRKCHKNDNFFNCFFYYLCFYITYMNIITKITFKCD
uniref:Uncharacterized protein n=1 Tax=Strongyloides papillosus TaxID=174720 RepID=A0A0N5C9V2_STREA